MTIRVLESGYVYWRKGPYVFAQWPCQQQCTAADVFTTDGLDQEGNMRRFWLAIAAQRDYEELKEPR